MRYIRFVVENREPLRIGDDETSQHGQTDTLHYIPGSAVRGMVVQALVQNPAAFEEDKKTLFSNRVHFLNAYPMVDGRDLIPSLKGFYEDKTEVPGKKLVENVLLADLTPGSKRASLGRFGYVEGDCFCYTDARIGETMHINRGREGKRTLFFGQYLEKGQCFSGFITFDDSVDGKVIDRVKDAFGERILFGSRRFAGYGSCCLREIAVQEGLPYGELRGGTPGAAVETQVRPEAVKDFYLALLSDTSMRSPWGETVGLCLSSLAEKLDCGSLRMLRCAASTAESHAYNRIWRGAVPSAVMYSAGSVFHLKAERPVSWERIARLEEQGIGIRRNEGFGQIAVLPGYGEIRYKQAIGREQAKISGEREDAKASREMPEEFYAQGMADLKTGAKGLLTLRMERAMERYMAEHPLRLAGISRSKLGVVESMCQEFQYAPMEAKEQLERFIEHDAQKDERSKKQGRKTQDALHKYVNAMLSDDLLEKLSVPLGEAGRNGREILGIPIGELLTQEELMKYRLRLIIGQIRYASREVKKGGR